MRKTSALLAYESAKNALANGLKRHNLSHRFKVYLRLAGAYLAVAFLFAAADTCVAADRSPLDSATTEATTVYVALRVNGLVQPLPIRVLLDETKHTLWLGEADLRALRLRLPTSAEPMMAVNERFHSLGNVVGARFEFDAATQSISIYVPATAFESDQSLSTSVSPATAQLHRGYSAFVTYDAYAEHTDSRTSSGGVFALAATTPLGSLSSTQFVASGINPSGDSGVRTGRLDTTFTIDSPDLLLSLRVGDFIANSANLTSPVRMGGIQLASNFVVRPGFVTYPMSTIGGQASLPSVAELFINGASAGAQNVAPGPFTINNVPLVNGAGEVTLVVRDVLGREKVVVSSFFGSSQLLAPGLSDYSLSIGKPRYHYGTDSFDYRGWVGSGFWRYGVSPHLTTSVNADLSKRVANVGTGITFLLPGLAEINASAAVSRTNFREMQLPPTGPAASDYGHALLVGADRRAPGYGFGARLRYESPSYRTVADGNAFVDGFSSNQLRREFNAYASLGLGSLGGLNANYVTQTKVLSTNPWSVAAGGATSTLRTGQLLSLGYNLPMGKAGQVAIGVSRSVERSRSDAKIESKNTSVFVNYFLPLDALHSISASSTRTDSTSRSDSSGGVPLRNISTSQLLTTQRSLPEGEGYGYKAQVGDGALLRLEGRAALPAATLGLDYAQSNGARGIRASASGAISTIDGDIYASRRITDSFVVVDTGGFSQVGVHLDNNFIGRTDASGRLFVPSVRAYQAHTISIDATDLPLSAEVDQTKLAIVTTRSGGAALKFSVRLSRGAQIRLHDELGTAIPAGAVATIGDRVFPIAQDGEAFLLGLEPSNELIVRVGSKGCRVQVSYLASNDPLPHLGMYVCQLQ